MNHIDIFTNIYNNCGWDNNRNLYYRGSSGPGSSVNFNIDTYIPFIKEFIINNNIKTIVDLGCGDFRCGTYIYNDLDISYQGYDAYDKVILYNQQQFSNNNKYHFTHLDFYNEKEQIINADLCILKDVLQHWSNNEISTFLNYIINSNKFKYIIIVNCGGQTVDNIDIETGGWRELSCVLLPLKQFNPKKIFNYHSKEVSLIRL